MREVTHDNPRKIEPIRRRSSAAFEAVVPGSKSQTLRALTIAAMCEGRSQVRGALRAEDTDRFAAALAAFGGVQVRGDGERFEVVRDAGRPRAPAGWLDVGAGAAPARFLAAFAAGAEGACRITGTPRLRQRPMAAAFAALRSLGVACECVEIEGRLPVVVHGAAFATRDVEVEATESSQFASALMLALSAHDAPATLRLRGDAVSRPYLELTRRMLAEAGVRWVEAGPGRWLRQGGSLGAREFRVEPDASSAGYFFALAAATGTRVAVEGIPRGSVQADLALLDALVAMGCDVRRADDRVEVVGAPLRGVDVDLRDAPDAAPTIAALATMARGATTIRGVAHLRDKESDRITAICDEAERLGARATSGADWIRVEPTGVARPAIVRAHDDHRIAMAFAVVGAVRDGVQIADPQCVAKSFPGFWDEFDRFLAHHAGRDGAADPRHA